MSKETSKSVASDAAYILANKNYSARAKRVAASALSQFESDSDRTQAVLDFIKSDVWHCYSEDAERPTQVSHFDIIASTDKLEREIKKILGGKK